VLFVLPPWRIEFSVAAFILTVVLALLLGLFLSRALAETLSLPSTIRAFRLNRRKSRAKQAVIAAVENYFEGQYARAERLAEEALSQGEAAGLCAVVAARSAHQQRKFDERDRFLDGMHSLLPQDRVLQLITRADLLLDEHREQEAFSAIREAQKLSPRSQAVKRLTLRAQIALQQWDLVLKSLQTLEKSDALDPVFAATVRRQAHLGLMVRYGHDPKQLRAFWNQLSEKDREDRSLVISATNLFASLNMTGEAREAIERALNHRWDSDLAALYGRAIDTQPIQQIQQAERWLLQHPDDAGLLLSLGLLCLHQSLWGKAQTYLEASLALNPRSKEVETLLESLGPNRISRAARARPLPPDIEAG
jgi:HemY protein